MQIIYEVIYADNYTNSRKCVGDIFLSILHFTLPCRVRGNCSKYVKVTMKGTKSKPDPQAGN